MSAKPKSIIVKVGNVSIGGGEPVVIQSMTNTDTADVSKTTQQIIDLYEEGSEIVRITVDRDDAAKAVDQEINTATQNERKSLVSSQEISRLPKEGC